MNSNLLAILVCPLCKGPLEHHKAASTALLNEELWCRADALAFPVIDDMPALVQSEARALSSAELE